MKNDTDRKRAERDRKKAEGLVERTVWVRPEIWEYIRAIVDALNKVGTEHKENEK